MEYSKAFRERLREEIIADEGCVLEVYKDHLGYYTVGVGHLILPSDEEWETPVGTRITQPRADELLFQDFNIMLEDIALLDVNGNLMTDLFPLGGISDGRDYS